MNSWPRAARDRTYTLHSVVNVTNVDQVALQETGVVPSELLRPLLVDQEPRPQLLGLDIQEAGQLGEVHGGVKTKVGLDSRVEHVGLDLIHKDGQVVLDGVDVALRLVKVGWHRGDELGAGSTEQLLEDGERLGATTLQLQELVAVLLPKRGVNGVVKTGGVESHADGNEGVHLIVLLGDRVILGILLEVLGPRNEDQNVAEHANSVGIAAHHHVGETNIIVCGKVGSHDAGEHGLLVELNVVQGLESETEITEQAVHPEQTDDGKVTKHAVERLGAVLAGNSHGVLAPLGSSQLFGDLRPLNEGVEDVENAVAAPGVGVLLENLDFLLVVCLSGDPRAVRGKRVELVDELVDNVPSPVVLFEQC